MLAIIEYGAGNQTSVVRALKSMGIECIVSSDPHKILDSDGVIFPGVGAAPQAMKKLSESGLDNMLRHIAEIGLPLLGICLGCQILLTESEEGNCSCLGILKGKSRRFSSYMKQEDGSPAPVPHMGWNALNHKTPSRILAGIGKNAEFYFVHSYYPQPEEELVLATASYGEIFCAVYGRDGLWAVQFHPEKSGRGGLRLLANFNSFCEDKKNALQKNYPMS